MVHAWTEGGGPAVAIPCGAILGLACAGGRHAPASVHACMKRGECQPLPHYAEPFLDSHMMVGGTHQHVSTPGRTGVPAAILHGAVFRLARDGGMCLLASPRRWEARTGRRPHLDKKGVPTAATPHRAFPGLARDGGRHAPASVHAWTMGVPAIAAPCGAVPGLAHDGGRHAPASVGS
jgi:hypothetical protein